MTSQRRIDDFRGTDSEYIAYLESIVRQAIATQHPPPSPSRSAVRREASNDSDGEEAPRNSIEFIPYEPETDGDDSRPAKKQRGQPRWEHEMDNMLHDLNDPDWSSVRKAVGLSSSNDILAAFDILIGTKSSIERPTNTDTSLVCYDASNAVLQLLDAMGSATSELKIRKKFARQIYLFHKFVFVSTCSVALYYGVDPDKVDEIMRRHISDTDGRNLDRLRSGALWVNRMMSKLAADGLGYMAYELFVVREL